MEKFSPPGLNEFHFALIEKLSNKIISLHNTFEDAEEFRNNSAHLKVSETVDLVNEVNDCPYW